MKNVTGTPNFTQWVILALKGMGMGAANVVPGVSGGTIAFITGIYERLVNSISSFDSEAVRLLFTGKIKECWKHIDGYFLSAVLAGVIVATFSLAKLMLVLLENHPVQTWAFFFGLIIASSILILGGLKNWKAADFAWLAAGGLIGVLVCTMTPMETPDGLWFIFICGAVSICAMILPGISGSFILLVMGKYESIMKAIDGVLHLDAGSIAVLAVFALGCVVGILAFAKLLHWLLSRYNRQTVIALAGFILGSLVKVWPWNAYDSTPNPLTGEVPDPHILAAILWCIGGIILVLGLEWAGKRASDRQS